MNRILFKAGRYYCLRCQQSYWSPRQAMTCKHAKPLPMKNEDEGEEEEDDEEEI